METNYKNDITPEMKQAINARTWINDKGEHCLSFASSTLDFTKTFVLLGFRGKKQVLLGDFYNNEMHKKIGFVRDAREGKYSLWTDGFRYSLKIWR